MSKSIAVFGLGRFGKSLALSLYETGVQVMVVDKNESIIENISDKVTYAVIADLTNPDDIKGIGLEDIDIVVVAMGSDLTASIMSIMVSKELGVKQVIAKASDERMGSILSKVGADRILYPEEESGSRTARILTSDNFMEFFDIDDNLCLLEMKPKKEWVGKTLMELNLRKMYKINVVAIKGHNGMKSYIDPTRKLEENNNLLVVLDKNDLKLLNK
ncbi:MAG: TrkA family potassium uptake protein [Eubacterium sp.]|nr:TrkA family potassium uptake protein [Eubacterium sp.]